MTQPQSYSTLNRLDGGDASIGKEWGISTHAHTAHCVHWTLMMDGLMMNVLPLSESNWTTVSRKTITNVCRKKKRGLILTHDGKWRRLCYTRLLTIWFQFSLKDFLTKKRKEFCLELKYLRSQQPASKTTCIYCLLSLKDILGCSPTGRQWISVRLKWD